MKAPFNHADEDLTSLHHIGNFYHFPLITVQLSSSLSKFHPDAVVKKGKVTII